MKKALTLALACVIGLGIMASAGPAIGINFEPEFGKKAEFSFGWELMNWTVMANKSDLSTWTGDFSLLVAWTPNMGSWDLRVGPQLDLGLAKNGLKYIGLGFVLGAQKSWDMVNFYGQMEISSAYKLVPRLGFEIEFTLPSVQTGMESGY